MDDARPLPALQSVAQARAAAHPPGGHPMEIWISYVLRAGVLLAAAIIGLGLALLLIQGPGTGQASSLHDLQARAGQPIAINLGSIVASVLHGSGAGIIQLGLLVLILTPIARVAMTALLFLVQRDRAFIAVTAVVLAILVLGLIGVGA